MPNDFDGLYKDQLVPRLLREERIERWALQDSLKDEFKTYHQRMPEANSDYYHRTIGEACVTHTVVMKRKVRGTGQGEFDHVWSERLSLEGDGREPENTILHVERFSLAQARHSRRFSWRQDSERIYRQGPGEGLVIATLQEGPTSHQHIRNVRQYQQRRLADLAFAPKHFHPENGEVFDTKQRFYAALGIIASLDSTTQIVEGIPEGVLDRALVLNPHL